METTPQIKDLIKNQSKNSTPSQYDLSLIWLKFWNYIILPFGGVLGILFCIAKPDLSLIFLTITLFQFTTAYGLHFRKLWAWKTNWIIIITIFLFGLIPTSNLSYLNPDSNFASVEFTIRLIILMLIWNWPQSNYWRKRKTLFC